jgi:hypothetical protein
MTRPPGEVVESRNLLGQEHRIAQGKGDHRRAEMQARGVGAHGGQGDENLVEAGRIAPLRPHVRGRGDVVVAPHPVVAQLLSRPGEADEVGRRREGHGVHQPLRAGRELDADAHYAVTAASARTVSSGA